MARPRTEIDYEQFEKLCAMQCSLGEIAGWFGCSEDTVERWCKREYGRGFADVWQEKRQSGRISLRRAQFELAKKSAAMAIFLGKQYLGQRDTPMEITHTVSPIDQITAEIFRVQEEQRAVEAEAAAVEDDN